MKKIFFAGVLLFAFLFSSAQDIDVQHYTFQLTLSDANDTIKGTADIQVKFLQPVRQFALDLVQQKNNGKGMQVQSVTGNDVSTYAQANDQILVVLKNN